MQFQSEAERLQHPQAKLIPKEIWDTWFNVELSESAITLMQLPDKSLLEQVKALKPSILGEGRNVLIWIAIFCSNPNLNTAILIKLADQLKVHNSNVFLFAAHIGRLDVIKHLEANCTPAKLQQMIEVGCFWPFRYAARNGHLAIVEYLITTCEPTQLEQMIAEYSFDAFTSAAAKHRQPVVNRLLTLPSVFAYAEMHVHEYGDHVQPFIQETLTNLRSQQQQSAPNVLFDITDPEQAKLYFYMLRHLIRRRNDPNNIDDIRFLLNIPAVKALVHTAVTPNEPNELLRLALSPGNLNLPAVELLMAIPAVRELAEQNNHYRAELRGEIDLARLAQNPESSMMSLSPGQKKRLADAEKHYKPLLQKRGLEAVMGDLRKDLENRYQAAPASIRAKGKVISLPLTWKAFQALKLNAKDKKAALEAYYRHKTHTALRYLSKPNHWMDANAAFVTRDASGAWADFEAHQPLIAILYLAMTDKEIAPIDGFTLEPRVEQLINEFAFDGFTLETRVEQFINEFALLGRSHNWDSYRTRINNEGKEIKEQYDNLKGDKPSCFSGAESRILQAASLGHPLIKLLTADTIAQALKSFIYQHFKDKLQIENSEAIKAALEKRIMEFDDSPETIATLKSVDISQEQQTQFIQAMTTKYGAQFSEEKSFLDQINEIFCQEPKFRSHIEKFYTSMNIVNLLALPSAVASTSSAEVTADKNRAKLLSATHYPKRYFKLCDIKQDQALTLANANADPIEADSSQQLTKAIRLLEDYVRPKRGINLTFGLGHLSQKAARVATLHWGRHQENINFVNEKLLSLRQQTPTLTQLKDKTALFQAICNGIPAMAINKGESGSYSSLLNRMAFIGEKILGLDRNYLETYFNEQINKPAAALAAKIDAKGKGPAPQR